MAVAKRIVGLSFVLAASGLALAALLVPWSTETASYRSCWDIDDCEDGTVRTAYGTNSLRYTERGESGQATLRLTYGDLRELAASFDEDFDGTGLAKAAHITLIVVASLGAVALLFGILGLLVRHGFGHAGAAIAAGTALLTAGAATLLLVGIAQMNEDLREEVDPSDPWYVEGDAVAYRGLQLHVGPFLAGGAVVLATLGAIMSPGRSVVSSRQAAQAGAVRYHMQGDQTTYVLGNTYTPRRPPAPSGTARMLQCPRCFAAVRTVEGVRPVCKACGFT